MRYSCELNLDQMDSLPDPALNRAAGKRFRSLLQKAWKRVLPGLGFEGKGAVFRRRQGGVLHVVETQGWKYGGGMCVNLGIHFDCLPPRAGHPSDLGLYHEYHCAVRKRLMPAGRTGDFWWRYGDDEVDSQACVDHLVATFEAEGLAYFERLGCLPGPYPGLDEEGARRLFSEVMIPGPKGAWSLVCALQ